MKNQTKLFIVLMTLALVLVTIQIIKKPQEKTNYFVPLSYNPPSISHELALQYKAEEQQLYDKINYNGTQIHYISPRNID